MALLPEKEFPERIIKFKNRKVGLFANDDSNSNKQYPYFFYYLKRDNSKGEPIDSNDAEVLSRKIRGELSFQEAKEVRGKSFGALMAEKLVEGGTITGSFRATLSEKSKARAKGIKEKFDPMNIARFMTGGSSLGAALVGKMTGRSKEDMEYFTGKKSRQVSGGDTATKIGSLDPGNEMVDILTKIYTLLQQVNSNTGKEKENNFKEEQDMEKARRDKALLDALKSKKNDKEEQTAEKIEKETGQSPANVLDDILGFFGGAASGLNLLKTVGAFFMGPVGLAIVGVASLAALFGLMMGAKPESHEEASKVQKAADLSSEGAAIMEAVNDVVLGRKNRLLSQRPSNKKSLLFWKDEDLQKQYLKEIGFDEKTGLTEAEKSAGYNSLDENGNPVRKEKVTQQSTNAPAASTTPTETSEPTTTPAGKPSAAFVSSGSTSQPSSATNETTTQTQVAPAPSSDGLMVSSEGMGSKLSSVTSENLDSKLITPEGENTNNVLNNIMTSRTTRNKKQGSFPFVRNQEPTFQRMILNSTRVV